MFIGRERELAVLEENYQKSGFSMTILYGRRRVGKSMLLSRFIEGKKAIYYTATKVGKERNLEILSKQVTEILAPDMHGVSFSSLEALFDFITDRLPLEKLIFVIDELPYWAEKDEALLSIFQKYIDTVWQDKNLYIILCGSALSFMEDKILSEKSPLFGRRDSQIKLQPFNYLEAALFVPDYSCEEKAICYGITGGVAKYLAMLDPKKSLDDNIKQLFFHTDGYLYDETRNLLTQEFSDITLVNNIIEQIASGETTVNVISGKVHEKESTVLYSLGKLISVGLVEKRLCITEEKNKKKTQYVLKDYMFKFWYRFIPRACSVIELGAGDDYYERAVKPYLHEFMSKVFEDMCGYFTLREGIKGRFGCFLTETGSWWGMETIEDSEGKKKSQTADIDMVGISAVDKVMVVGECKFRNEKMDKPVYETLIRRSHVLSAKYPIKKYLLFSLGGFTDWFKQAGENVELFTLEEMYR